MLDIHCHIIPGVDDGPKTIEQTMEMLTIAEDDGVSEIVATPHFFGGHYETPRDIINSKVKELNKLCQEQGRNIKIYSGQEVYLDSKTLDNYEEKTIDTIEGTNYMLIELNPYELHKDTFDILYELRIKGVTPIIAHPERYNYIMEDITLLNKFIEEKCLFQLTAGSIEGVFGSRAKKAAMDIIKYDLCNFIASDAHGSGKRSPIINSTIKNIEREKGDISINSYKDFKEKYYKNKKIIIENKKGIKKLFGRFMRN